MKTKIGISLVMALLMIASAFTVVNADTDNEVQTLEICPPGSIDFTKSVWNETSEEWEDAVYDVMVGETVRFNISLTYNKHPSNQYNWQFYNITIWDTLPECLEFADNVTFFNAEEIEENQVGNIIYWNFTDCGQALNDSETMTIEFDCEVIESEEKENQNIANVEGTECSFYDHEAEDDAWVFVYVAPPIEFIKEVWDPVEQEWVDLLEGVQIGDEVIFRIVITYVGYEDVELMKCMIVDDYLPECCLEYIEDSEVFTYPDVNLFDDPEITIDGNHITYDWSNKMFNLFVDETIIIEFKAEVFEYCYDIVENCAFVDLWSCYNCPDPVHLYADDCAEVNCTPPPSTFEKTVWDSELGWTEETSVFVGDTVSFKIELTYYGNYNLTMISIVDYLPCCLEFIEGSADPEETNVSEDLKTIWWNFTDPLEDGDTLTIEFDALATDTTGCGSGINIACVSAYEMQTPFNKCDTAEVTIDINNAPCAPDIEGDTYGEPGEELTFRVTSCDPNGDDLYYWIDWGDGSNTGWIGPYNSCEEVETTNSWESEGEYIVKAKAKDTFEEESEWSHYPLTVVIEEEEPLEPELEVTIKRGFGRKISVDIENTGEIDVNDITWNLTVSRRGLFKRTLLATNGSISTLGVGLTETIEGSPFGLGLITVTVDVEAPGLNPIQKTAKGFIFLRFVRVK